MEADSAETPVLSAPCFQVGLPASGVERGKEQQHKVGVPGTTCQAAPVTPQTPLRSSSVRAESTAFDWARRSGGS